MTLVPEGLQVGGETDHTVLLEVTAEGILSSENWLAIIFQFALQYRPSKVEFGDLTEGSKVRGFREGESQTYPSAGAQTVRVRHDGGVVVGAC